MSATDKMKEIATTVSDKTKEYAPIVKEKVMLAYTKTKDFTMHVIIPKIKEGADAIKTKIEDFQRKKKTASTNTTTNTGNANTTANTVPPHVNPSQSGEHKYPENKSPK